MDSEAGTTRTLDDYVELYPTIAHRVRHEWHAIHGLQRVAGDAPRMGDPSEKTRPLLCEVGPYRPLLEIGRGGQGVVYLAEDTRFGRKIALKVLTQNWTALPQLMRARLQREASALSRLEHPNICSLLDAGVVEDSAGRNIAYLAMRFVEGETLAAEIVRLRAAGGRNFKDRAALDRVVAEIVTVARAIHRAHESSILHRDIKPGNIIRSRENGPVVLDFGLARGDTNDGVTLTQAGDWVGTPSYMSPEQLDPRRGPVDARADVWALGVTLYEYLALQRPLDGPSRDAIVREVLDGEPVSLAARCPGLPRELAVIVQTAMERDLARRYQSAAALADDLQRFRDRKPIAAQPASALLRGRRWIEREPALAGTLCGLMLVMAVGIAIVSVLWFQADSALNDVERLADARVLREMVESEKDLVPAVPERVTGANGMDAWLSRAQTLLARLPQHRSALLRFEEAARGSRKEESSPMGGSRTSSLWWKEQLEQLVRDLESFQATVKKVEERRAFAMSVVDLTIATHQVAWNAAAKRVAADPRFRGFILKPQVGLVPIGPDPSSGFEEFGHVQTGSTPLRDPATGKLQLDPDFGLVMILLPGGRVRTGNDPVTGTRPATAPFADPGYREWEGPSNETELSPFFISKYEMTIGQWRAIHPEASIEFHKGTTSTEVDDYRRQPCAHINLPGSMATLRAIGMLVPTEVQWEYAARGGATTPFWTGLEGRTLNGLENFADRYAKEHGGGDNWDYDLTLYDGWLGAAPVGTFAANKFGLHDVHGNLAEWVLDTWEDFSDHPARPGDGFRAGNYRLHLVRGADFANDTPKARLGNRRGVPPETQNPTIGVRPARGVDP